MRDRGNVPLVHLANIALTRVIDSGQVKVRIATVRQVQTANDRTVKCHQGINTTGTRHDTETTGGSHLLIQEMDFNKEIASHSGDHRNRVQLL